MSNFHLIGHAIRLGTKLAPLATPLLKRVDWQDISERTLGTKLPAALHAEANVVDALNASIGENRTPWSTTSLAIFILAHTRVDDENEHNTASTTWLKTPEEIVSFLLQNSSLSGDDLESLNTLLVKQCSEIRDIPVALLPHATLKISKNDVAGVADAESKSEGDLAVTETIVEQSAKVDYAQRIASIAKTSYTSSSEIVMRQRNALRQRKVIKLFAMSLVSAGYSTRQCTDLLQKNNFASTNVEAVLREDLTKV